MAQHDDVEQRRADKKAKALAKREQAELDAAVSGLLATVQGRKYLYWLLGIGNAIGVNPMSNDPYATAFRCGEQNVGQQVMRHIIDVSPVGFTTMLAEREAERQMQATIEEQVDENTSRVD